MNQNNEQFTGFIRHLKILQALSDISVRSYLRKVEEFFGWYTEKRLPGAMPFLDGLGQITRQDVESYLEWCFYRGNNNHTRLTKLIALKKYFRYLVYEGAIKEDITAIIPHPKVSRRFVQKFSKEDVLNFFRAINITTEKGIRDAVIIILAAFCGMRISEIINLNLNDIVDDGKTLDINVIESKHNSNRVVYLWKSPAVFIRKWLSIRMSQGAKSSDPFLISYAKNHACAGGNKRMTPVGIDQNVVKMYAEKASIRKPRIHIHMFRATHISDLRSIRGYDIAAIAQRAGHRHISSTDRYMPSRDRIHREYHSLAEYWHEFPTLWTKKEEKEGESNKAAS